MANGFWLTCEDVLAACKYALRDATEHYVDDIVGHADVKYNLSQVARRLKIDVENGFYEPGPLLPVEVPDRRNSVKYGAVISLLDLAVVYAAIMKLAPAMSPRIPASMLPYRWGAAREQIGTATDVELQELVPGDVTASDIAWDTPWGPQDVKAWTVAPTSEWSWCFKSWCLKKAKNAAAKYDYCAKAEISSFFENISLKAVHDHIRGIVDREGNGGDLADAQELLFRIYKHWAWTPGREEKRDNLVPQGNKISKFFANFALLEFDRAMEKGAPEGPDAYIRYVDDILIFTKKEKQARRALLECERALRESGFDLSSDGTRLVPSAELFDAEAERWLEKIEDPGAGPENAREFVEEVFTAEDAGRLGGVYFKALDVMREQEDDSAFDRALQLFLNNPGREFLDRNFRYLRHFGADRYFTGALVIKLARAGSMFPYHRYYLYRLATYGREYSPALRELALQDAVDSSREWYWRVGALSCLNSFELTPGDLEKIKDLVAEEDNPAVRRAALVTLWQRPVLDVGDAVKEMMSCYNVCHCEYLPEYFFRVTTERELAQKLLEEVRETDVRSPLFIDRLHQLDLLKNNGAVRADFMAVLDDKIAACDLSWMRLVTRLERVRECCALYNGM
jgi:hypothetical protein